MRQWISPHQHRKNSANERNSNLFESFTTSVAYFRADKYKHFFTINAQLEYYFFNYKEIATFSEGKKDSLTALLKTSIKRKIPQDHLYYKVALGIYCV